jgi:hypothetical protein
VPPTGTWGRAFVPRGDAVFGEIWILATELILPTRVEGQNRSARHCTASSCMATCWRTETGTGKGRDYICTSYDRSYNVHSSHKEKRYADAGRELSHKSMVASSWERSIDGLQSLLKFV